MPDPEGRAHDRLDYEIFTWSVPSDQAAPIAFHRSGMTIDPEETATLYDALIAPVAHTFRSGPESHLTFVPGMGLMLIPWAALIDDSGQPLIARHAISVTPSLHMLLLGGERRKRHASDGAHAVLVVGNPTLPDISIPGRPQRLKALPGAEVEAAMVARNFGATPLIGDAAPNVAVMAAMPAAALLHFATYGLHDHAVRGS